MKKVIPFTVILIIGIISLSGCQGFLNQTPKSSLSKSNFYQDSTQFVEAINGVYGVLQNTYNATSHTWGEERSDNTTFQYNAADRGRYFWEQFDYFELTTSNQEVEYMWSNMYRGIAQCNEILNQASNAKKLSSTFKNHIQGQAEFIRAFYYFNLVRLFGGVPLVTKPVNSPNEAYAKNGRATVKAVYKQIIKDATDAASKLPDSWPSDQAGRITKGAANTLLGDVYLTQKNYSSADKYFKKVIQSGTYSLLPDYAALYNPNNKNNSESIFEIQFSTSVTGEYSNYIYQFAPYNSGSAITGFNGVQTYLAGRNIPTHNMVNTYEKGDKRKAASIGWYVNPKNTQFGVAIGDSIPYVNKFAAKPKEPGKQDVDFYVYRYAQVLLWDAEALNEMGKQGQALPLINKVRERAGLSDLSGMSQSQFRTAVYHEERVENAFEYHRWFQLLRTGRAKQVMTQHGKEVKTYEPWLKTKGNGGYDIKSYKLLYPIPQRDVRLNHLKQNPGW